MLDDKDPEVRKVLKALDAAQQRVKSGDWIRYREVLAAASVVVEAKRLEEMLDDMQSRGLIKRNGADDLRVTGAGHAMAPMA